MSQKLHCVSILELQPAPLRICWTEIWLRVLPITRELSRAYRLHPGPETKIQGRNLNALMENWHDLHYLQAQRTDSAASTH